MSTDLHASGNGPQGPEESLSLQEAADHLGVHYMTMYRYVRLGLVEAHKQGGTWRVTRQELDAFVAPQRGRPSGDASAPWAERLEARMVAGDVSGAWAVVETAMASGTTPSEVYATMLAPALKSIGDKWSTGELGIEDEHLASSVAMRVIGRLSSRFARRGRPKGTVITVMPPGDRHSFSVAMLGDVLRGDGYEVMELGHDTPVVSLEQALRKADDLIAVCISVVYDGAVSAVGEMVDAVKRFDSELPVVLGGRAITGEDHALALGADVWAATPQDVAAILHPTP